MRYRARTGSGARRGLASVPILGAVLASLSALCAACLALSCASPGGGGSVEPVAFVSYPLAKIRPTERPAASSSADMAIAGGEYECLVIGLSNPGPGEMSVRGLAIEGPADSPFACEAFLVAYAVIEKKSRWFDPGSVKGRWPDPLLPIGLAGAVSGTAAPGQDGYETRRWSAPPGACAIPSGENRCFVLEFRLPSGRRSEGEAWRARIQSELPGGGALRELAFDFSVRSRGFDLPARPAAATACNFARDTALAAHERLSNEPFDRKALHLDYLELLARHRLSVSSPNEAGVPFARGADGAIVPDWSGFDAISGAMLDGTLFPGAPEATAIGIPGPEPALSGEDLAAFRRATAARFRERGWLARAYWTGVDEPLRVDYGELRAKAAEVKAADPGFRILVTEPFAPGLERVADVWCPDIPYIGDSIPFLPFFYKGRLRAEWQPHYPPSIYATQVRAGKEAWLYTCNTAVLADYPSLLIDADAQHARAIPWLMRRYGFTGFHYWRIVTDRGGPGAWGGLYEFPANGDGALLYPGVPGHPGVPGYPGTPGAPLLDRHVPLASLRLKALREGLEDYEYLALLERLGGAEEARIIAESIVKTSTRWSDDPEAMMAARKRAASAVEAFFR